MRLTEPFAQDPPRRPAELATFGSLSVMVVSPTRGLIERIGAELAIYDTGHSPCETTPHQLTRDLLALYAKVDAG